MDLYVFALSLSLSQTSPSPQFAALSGRRYQYFFCIHSTHLWSYLCSQLIGISTCNTKPPSVTFAANSSRAQRAVMAASDHLFQRGLESLGGSLEGWLRALECLDNARVGNDGKPWKDVIGENSFTNLNLNGVWFGFCARHGLAITNLLGVLGTTSP